MIYSMKYNSLLALAILLLAFSGCKKELDLLSGKFFGVKEFLQSKNCDAKCGESAACEGQVAGLEGLFDESNINADLDQFYVLDSRNEDFKMEVQVDPAISEEVFDLIRFRLTNDVRVRGEIEGFDQPMNFSCKRGFVLHLVNTDDLFTE